MQNPDRMNPKLHLAIPFISLISSLFLYSCSPGRSANPDATIIPRDSMVQLMADIHLADAILINAVNHRKIQVNQIPAYYSDILQRYNITKTRFDVSLRFYSDDLEKFDKMYDEILSLLNKRQAEVEAGN
jgi:hypothetical protein